MSPFGPPWIQLSAMYLEEVQRGRVGHRRTEEMRRGDEVDREDEQREDEQRGRAGKRSGEEEYVKRLGGYGSIYH